MYSEKDVLDTLLQKIYGIIAAPDTITNVPTARSFFSVCMPGIPLPPAALDFGFATMSDDQIQLAADFSDMSNIIPLWGASWRPSGRKVSDEYWKVIEQPKIPISGLTDDEKKAYERARSFLWTTQKMQDFGTGEMMDVEVPSLWVQRYDEYRKLWELARNAYDLEYLNYLNRRAEPGVPEYWSHRKVFLENQVRIAFAGWEGAGKRRVEEARALIGNLDGRGLAKSWQDRRQRFEQYKKGASTGDFLLTKYFPQKFWDNTGAWLGFSLTHKEVHKVNEEEQKNWGGGGGFGIGLFSFGGDASHESANSFAKTDTNNVQIGFDLAIVPLLRGWLDGAVFSGRSWNFDRNLIPESENLSDGAASPKGTMPLYPTALVLARNVRVSLSMTSETNRHAMSQVRGSAKAGWGPFSVRANYFRKTTKTTHDFVEDGAGLSAPGMQIIGFVCTVLNKCPNPDPNLKWA